MAFNNTQTTVTYNINGVDTSDLKVVFTHMTNTGITSVGALTLAEETSDLSIYEVPLDDEPEGIASLSTYNLLNSGDVGYDSALFESSAGVVASNGKESNYIAPPS